MGEGGPPRIRLLRRQDCPLCDTAEAVLSDLREEGVEFSTETVDVDGDDELRRRYGDRVPVALHEGKELFDAGAGARGIRDAVTGVVGEGRED